MSSSQIATLIVPESKKRAVDLKKIIAKYLYHWPLFLVFIAFFCGAALIYLKLAKPVYEVKASIIIKDEKKAPEQQSALQEIDFASSSKLLENEIEILKSRRLISQIVNKLQLPISYHVKQGFTDTDLYKSSPVKLTLLKPKSKAGHLNIKIKDQNTFLVAKKDGNQQQLTFDKVYNNKLGSWKLERTNNPIPADGSPIAINIADPESVTLAYQNSIDISSVNKLATTVVLSITDPIAQRGEDVLNELISVYSLANKQDKQRETEKTIAFLDQRLDSLSSALTTAEIGIESFKSSQGLTDISVESKINLENLQANDAQLNAVEVQLSVIRGIENYVNSPRNSGSAPATLGITDPALSNAIEKLSDLQLQRDRLLAVSPETHPDFEPINRQINTTKSAIRENIRNMKSSMLNTKEKLLSYNAGFESTIRNTPIQERQLISKQRQQGIQESLYTYLLQKREEIAVNYANTIFSDRIMEPAYAGPAKSPKKMFILAFALFLGFCAPVGIIFGRDAINVGIKDAYEIREATDVPIIAEIPLGKSNELISINTPITNAVSEQLRALRINLHYLYRDGGDGKITLITSSFPGEGKSHISSNLALTFTHIEKKTVILELDLRKPKIAEVFKIKKNRGITDYLNHDASLDDIIQVSDIEPNLHIISSGSAVNNPSELLERPKLDELFVALKGRYEHIIVDSPPVHLVPDALVLSRFSDSILYVIKQGTTPKSELEFIKDLQEKNQMKNMQIVFNGLENSKYGYNYQYNSYYTGNEKNSIFSDFWKRF